MKICIPVKKDLGLQSKVSAHFGSAPLFMLVDTESKALEPLTNANRDHEHGRCRPLAALGGHPVDAVVVGGIGRGAFLGLSQAGISVFFCKRKTVEETLHALEAGELPTVTEAMVCDHRGHGGTGPHSFGHGHGHGHGGGCGHHHDAAGGK